MSQRLKPWQALTEQCACGSTAKHRVVHVEYGEPILKDEPAYYGPHGPVMSMNELAVRTVLVCDDHYDDALAEVENGMGDDLRYTWSYWIRSLWWRPYNMVSHAFWKRVHALKPSR